jgi:hypothetical protein
MIMPAEPLHGRGNNSTYPIYAATGQSKPAGRHPLRPQALTFGTWDRDGRSRGVSQYIATPTAGKPNVLTQLTMFRLDPEGTTCQRSSL